MVRQWKGLQSFPVSDIMGMYMSIEDIFAVAIPFSAGAEDSTLQVSGRTFMRAKGLLVLLCVLLCGCAESKKNAVDEATRIRQDQQAVRLQGDGPIRDLIPKEHALDIAPPFPEKADSPAGTTPASEQSPPKETAPK
jgi:hypothetical protein